MTDNNPGLFEKIDAILEKRDALVLTDNVKINDDFPLLNEVIEDMVGVSTAKASELIAQSVVSPFLLERRHGQRRRTDQERDSDESLNSNIEVRLAELEVKFNSVLLKHMQSLEQDLNRCIREDFLKK